VTKFRRSLVNQRDKKNTGKIRPVNTEIKEGDMVLIYNVSRDININIEVKLLYRWKGPYTIDRIL